MTPSDSNPTKERHRRLWQRQAVIFGGLGLLLALALVLSLAQFSGLLPSPFARDFTVPEEEETGNTTVAVCPPADSVPVALKDLPVDVYNGTSRVGLAGATAKGLKELGLKVGQTGNFGAGYPGTALIRVNQSQIVQGYTISRLFPDSVVTLEERDTESIDVIVGDEYSQMAGADAVGDKPFVAPEGCKTPPEPPEEEAPAEGDG